MQPQLLRDWRPPRFSDRGRSMDFQDRRRDDPGTSATAASSACSSPGRSLVPGRAAQPPGSVTPSTTTRARRCSAGWSSAVTPRR